MLKNPVVDSPITGATKAKHLADAAAALEFVLTDDEVATLKNPYTPRQPTLFQALTTTREKAGGSGLATNPDPSGHSNQRLSDAPP